MLAKLHIVALSIALLVSASLQLPDPRSASFSSSFFSSSLPSSYQCLIIATDLEVVPKVKLLGSRFTDGI